MTAQILTQTRLKELLHYNPETGLFTRLIATCNRVKVGDIAGCLRKDGYQLISVGDVRYLAHRLAFLYMTGEFPKDDMDHIDHIRDNNKWVNLRPVTRQENGKNQSVAKNNTSGCTGVCWDKERSKWLPQITVSGKPTYLGRFDNKADAVAAYQAASIKYGFHKNHGH